MDADQARWTQPLDLAALGELTALWLEGAISTPMYRGWWQRAAVSGHCTRREADRLATISLESELIVITEFPGTQQIYELPISQDNGRANTRLAGRGYFAEPDDLWEGCHPETWRLLADSYHVAICDPCWGRDDLLWPSVVTALTASADRPGGLIRSA